MTRAFFAVIVTSVFAMLLPGEAHAGKAIVWIAEKAQNLPAEPMFQDPSTWLPWLLSLLGL